MYDEYTKERFAQDLFKDAMKSAFNLGALSVEERNEMYEAAATFCFEAANAFYKIAKENQPSYEDELPY